MFAKLKKKIKDDGGNVGEEKTFLPSPMPGHASPVRRNSATFAQTAPSKETNFSGDSGLSNTASPTSQSSEDSVTRDDNSSNSSRDEVLSMLLKRTEQCKKLEAKISEYAALIKDKNKSIEKLETVIENHDENTTMKLQEENEQYEASRLKMVELHQQELDKKEKEKQELADQLQKSEEFKQKLFKREEENDEFQGLTSQELAKVKHMLLLTQEDMSRCKQDLANKTKQCELSEKNVKELENELTSLKTKASNLEKECERLRDENIQHAKLVGSVTSEKAVFEKRLDEINAELSEKLNQLSKLNAQYAEMEGEFKTLQRNSDIHKNRSNKLLEEKDDHIDQLQERVKTLEQRVQDQCLSGGERDRALEAERDNLEHKLTETRQQLSDIKSTWSDKITHLEEQIAHLNTKIVEDNEELANNEKATENMRENFHKQLEDVRRKLDDAEKRALENWELASQKDRQYDKQKHELETELSSAKLEWVDKETQLIARITSLETQMHELQTARNYEKNEYDQKLGLLESGEQQYLEKELKFEKDIKNLELEHAKLQAGLTGKLEECAKLKKDVQERKNSETVLLEKVSCMETEVQALKHTIDEIQKENNTLQAELGESEKEKDELLIRNAELSQQMEAQRQQSLEKKHELEADVRQKIDSLTTLQMTVNELQGKTAQYEKKVEDFEAVKSQSVVDTATVGELQKTVITLQDQLTDKNRALKKQEQTLKDLRITLQRELKVQALPNDDSNELRESSHSPVPNRKMNFNKPLFLEPWNSPSQGHKGQMGGMTFAQATAAALLSHDDAKLRRGAQGIRQELDKDVNFQYLKHVILKFMLSRESEAIQLIKAVAVLLHFTREEQELIKQTLEWKMSWFGPRPSLGRGQTSKFIPPSY